MPLIRVADYIMSALSVAGVRHVFQVTGRGSLFLSDALAKSPDLKSVSLHHEQSCGFAAVSYAECTDSIGACLVSTGCAATNAITPVLSAWQDGVPTVFISGQNILNETTNYTGLSLRTYGQQESNIVEIVRSITKYSRMLTKSSDIYEVVQEAFTSALSGRKGPVWLDIPLDLQSSLVEADYLNELSFHHSEALIPASHELNNLAGLLSASERPVIMVGKGVRLSQTESALAQLVETYNIPIVYSASAPDIYGSKNSLSIGSVGSMGCSRAGNFAVANSDLLIVLGSRLTSLTTGTETCKFAREAKIVVVDIDHSEHEKPGINIDLFINCDLAHFFPRFTPNPHRSYQAWVDQCLHWKKIFSIPEPEFISNESVDLYQFSELISRYLPNFATLVTDSGLIEVILPTNIAFSADNKCIHPASQGAMGFALPAAIGASFSQDSLVMTVIGDGSIMMNLQELQTISYHQLPIKIFIVNNNCYSIIRRRQRDLFRKRTVGTDASNGISCPDFHGVADAFGIPYLKASNITELEQLMPDALSSSTPIICEVIGRPDQDYIEVSHARRSSDNRLVRRPLEDQRPFLSRELFNSEMLVSTIDQ